MLTRAAAIACLVAPAAGQPASWSQLAPASSPVPAAEQALAHDVSRGVTVLYGANRKTETWEWNGTAWSMTASGGPSGTEYHRMVWDSGRNRLVMVHAPSGFLKTWEWTGHSWAQQTTTTSPPTRHNFALAFDSGRNVTVLFGGSVGGNDLSDTWEYDGNDWSQRASGGPAGRYHAAMAYDAARGECVLFGGMRDNSPTTLSDTWVWNGTSWVEHFGVAGPLPIQSHVMAYDPDRESIVLFGGWAPSGPIRGAYDDTWEWDGTAWTVQPVTTARPALGQRWSMAYSPSRKKMDLFGGAGATWEYSGAGCLPGDGYTMLGFGTVGAIGHVPRFDACGEYDPRNGGDVTLRDAPGHTPALFLISLLPVKPVHYPWGSLVAQPILATAFVTNAQGEVKLALPGGMGAATVLAQWAVLDPRTSAGIALSNALRIRFR